MAAASNPFTPAFGTSPLVLAGRDAILQDMRAAFTSDPGNPNLSTLIIGARGTGKTALMSGIRGIASEEGWIAVGVTALPGLLEDIYEQAIAATSHLLAPEQTRQITSLTVGPVAASWSEAKPEGGNWRTRMSRLVDALAPLETGLLITVDEVQAGLDELVQLAAIYQHFVTEGRKVSLVMAGLPFHVDALVSDKTVSFLRRSFQHRLGAIDDADVADAFRRTVVDGGKRIDTDALDLCVDAIDGFAYMLQLVGFRAWNAALTGTITAQDAQAGIQAARRDMETHILSATYRELSAKDIAFLEAMLSDREFSRMGTIAERLGVSTGYASQYRTRLLSAGAICEVGRGRVAFAFPGLREYVAERVED